MDKWAIYLERVRTAYPELVLETANIRTAGGQFNDILNINGELIFRFPRTPDAAKTLATEVAILRGIQARLPLPVPAPTYVGTDPHTGELLFMGYRRIPGEPLRREMLAGIGDGEVLGRLGVQLATFLRELHAFPVGDIGTPLPLADGVDYWTGMYDAFRQELFGFLRADARHQVKREFEAFLGEPRHFDWRPILRHGDFGNENLLYDPHQQEITGVIDFGFVALGDPAVDHASLPALGGRFLDRFYLSYPDLAAASVRERAQFYRSTYALQQALWALRVGDEEDFRDGIAAYV